MSKIFCFLFVLILFPFFSLPILAQEDNTPKWDLKSYQMVFLYRGENRSQDSLEAVKIQGGHLANIQRLSEEGKLIVAGPFLDNQDLRGIFIFDCESEDEVKELLKTDPAIIAGRLKYEIRPWMTDKNNCFK